MSTGLARGSGEMDLEAVLRCDFSYVPRASACTCIEEKYRVKQAHAESYISSEDTEKTIESRIEYHTLSESPS